MDTDIHEHYKLNPTYTLLWLVIEHKLLVLSTVLQIFEYSSPIQYIYNNHTQSSHLTLVSINLHSQ